ncbi:hypothetical protein [Antribacter gilvus]|uniref:hypothetical protein n=1 Tax=Antribacter gilvus TaxID=2304675 RepID=UPI000F7AC588|nr:hypothetical protein [Antribacter gilvus]
MAGSESPREGIVGEWAEALVQVTRSVLPLANRPRRAGRRSPGDGPSGDNVLQPGPVRRVWKFAVPAIVAGGAMALAWSAWAFAPVVTEARQLPCDVGPGTAHYAADVAWVEYGRDLVGLALPDPRDHLDVTWATTAQGEARGEGAGPASGSVSVVFRDPAGVAYPAARAVVADGTVTSRDDISRGLAHPASGAFHVAPPRALLDGAERGWVVETVLAVDGMVVASCEAWLGE